MDEHLHIKTVVAEAVREALGEQMPGRYIDMSRIPLICQNIDGIHKELVTITHKLDKQDEKYVSKEGFLPVRLIVFGFVGLVLVAVISALIGLVVYHGI